MVRKIKLKNKVCVIGLGYVGLPLALAFAKAGLAVIGFDINAKKIEALKKGVDFMGENLKKDLQNKNIFYTSNPSDISKADYVIVAVPTPVTKDKKPDFSYVNAASEIVGRHMKRGCIVAYESTVYPGATEEICVPILEKESGMKCGVGFKIGYSPERINPGDKKHTVDKIVKVVAGMDDATRDELASLYGMITKAGVYKARDIKTAEAAKVIENIQRDLNIALMNELSLIFNRMGLNTTEVIEAASTKWNFHPYKPGLVGGHCIPVDPYYLLHKAQELGYKPQVILAGRNINNSMPEYVAELALEGLRKAGKNPEKTKTLLMGLTFKENVRDYRTSPSKSVISTLKKHGVEVVGLDPMLENNVIEKEFGIRAIEKLSEKFDVVILAVGHDAFKSITLGKLKDCMTSKPVLIDVRGFYSRKEALSKGFTYKQL